VPEQVLERGLGDGELAAACRATAAPPASFAETTSTCVAPSNASARESGSAKSPGRTRTLDAVAEHALAVYVAGKALAADGAANSAANNGDPVADLRAAWDVQVGFGLANAALYGLLTDPSRVTRSPAMAEGLAILRARVHRIAAAGRLRVTERRAVELIRAAGTGAVLTLLTMEPQDRDPGLADAMYDAAAQAILTDQPAPARESTTAAAVAFLTVVPDLPLLTDTERALLSEWLERAAGG
jgi:hypothetical protein